MEELSEAFGNERDYSLPGLVADSFSYCPLASKRFTDSAHTKDVAATDMVGRYCRWFLPNSFAKSVVKAISCSRSLKVVLPLMLPYVSKRLNFGANYYSIFASVRILLGVSGTDRVFLGRAKCW